MAKRTNIYLTEELYEFLRTEAFEKRTSMARIIRRLLVKYKKEVENEK